MGVLLIRGSYYLRVYVGGPLFRNETLHELQGFASGGAADVGLQPPP